ncbi:MAG TPA: DUF2442 domain-containing protein [Verrucomicrobiota bacterium]|nr:DUF2442 domain-containing protein [Verrucomicrobiota bacterium]
MVRIETAQPLAGHRLKVRFDDGLEGVYAVEPERRGGVFLKLLDAKVFNAVTVNPDFGCVEWPGGIDLCPDTMHQAMTGSAVDVEQSTPTALREDAEKKQ